MYLTERSSPLVPGARPSNSSDARTLRCASIPSGVIASSAGSKRCANSSEAKSDGSDVVAAKEIAISERTIARRSCALQLFASMGRSWRRFAFLLLVDADFLQKRLYRLLASEELLD